MQERKDQLDAACEIARRAANTMSDADMPPSVISCALWRTAAQIIGAVSPGAAIDVLIDEAARLMKKEAHTVSAFAAEVMQEANGEPTEPPMH
ncbi:hypothetical protein [Brucella intermedia]|uniref:Uncharacterized protein n=1 Tax=Brucella intermedia M86 TaxID=1234597 RepID=M5JSH4_9HYPH|nr:hypothetical protein [Brucella intermedia]ELT50997.1 hypothetical protein D584_01348 [Brucella intermedia M86]